MPPTVLITGSSAGIGRAAAQYFSAQGWNVAATARDPEAAPLWLHPRNVIAPRLDVTDEASIAAAVAATLERFGSIDVLVNNAGYGLFGPLEGATGKQLEAVFRTNVFGAAAMIRHVLPHMRERRRGVIVNISSVAGRFGSPFLAPYHASKYALEGLSESLRFELRAHGVRVKLVEPGQFKSDFLSRSLQWLRHPAYEPQLTNMMGWVAQSERRARETGIVARAIFEAANDSSDRLRYPVGATALLLARALLPDAIWRRLLRTAMNRPPRPRGNRRAQAAG